MDDYGGSDNLLLHLSLELVMTAEQERHRLEVAERQLALVQSFFPRLDSKVSAMFAISSAQIAVAALNLSADDLKLWYVAIPATAFLLAIIYTLISLYRCAYPHLEGGSQSLVYFAEIAKRTESDYIKQYAAVSVKDLTDDLSGQIWRNSEIVSTKYRWLNRSTIAAMLSLIPWTMFLLATSLTHWRVPVVGG